MNFRAALQMPLVRIILTSLWGGLLLLPFKGLLAAAVLSGALFALLAVAGRLKKLDISSAVMDRANGLAGQYRYHLIFAAALLFAILPFALNHYYIDVLIIAGIYAILAVGLNVIVGYTGLLNLGFAAFYAVGAYSYALLNTKFGLGFWTCLPLSAVLAALAGILLAVPALRLRGDYLAIVTLGFGEIVHLALKNWTGLTNGPNGISGLEAPQLFGFSLSRLEYFYFLVFAFLALTVAAVRRTERSRIGRAWKAIRENEIAASSIGINTTKYKLFAFAFGAFWAGLAGILFAAKMQFVSPESFTFMESVLIISMVILGGLGNIYGAVLGAFILVLLPEMLRDVQLYRMLLLGLGLVLLMRYRPQGLLRSK